MSEAPAAFRGFVAVPLPEPVRASAGAVVDRLRDAGEVRWTATANFHLTLKFLGDVPPAVLPELVSSLRSKLQARSSKRDSEGLGFEPEHSDAELRASSRSAARRAFDIELGGLGAFPRVERPQVIWIGVTEGHDRLAALGATVEDACAAAGFARETRPFRAHLTLGRLRDTPGALGSLPDRLQAEGAVSLGPARVEAIHLMKSTLTPKGPIYRVMESFLLDKGASLG